MPEPLPSRLPKRGGQYVRESDGSLRPAGEAEADRPPAAPPAKPTKKEA